MRPVGPPNRAPGRLQDDSPNKKPEGELLTTSDVQQAAHALPDVFRAPVRAQEPLALEVSEILPVENGAGWSIEGANHHLSLLPLAPFEISSPFVRESPGMRTK